MLFRTLFLANVLVFGGAAYAYQYVPIGTTQQIGHSYVTFTPTKIADRPYLPGARPIELELLEDALRRKYSRRVGDDRGAAQRSIIRNSMRDPVKRSHIRGIMAEARFLQRNPKWGYVRKPNATQNDVYTWRQGRFIGAQIKTHWDGNPSKYAADMLDDHKAEWFVVPDDHVEALKENWRERVASFEANGRSDDAMKARRQLNRIRPLGETMPSLTQSHSRAERYALREQHAGYVTSGATIGMLIGQDLWNYWQTGSMTDEIASKVMHAYADMATVQMVNKSLEMRSSRIPSVSPSGSQLTGRELVRGGARANIFTGVAVLASDTAVTIYDYGGERAFSNPLFTI